MSIFSRLFGRSTSGGATVQAMAGEAAQFYSMDDPRLLEFMRKGGGAMTEAGISVSPRVAMRNTTVLRCVSLISFAIGMLPLHLQRKADNTNADDHPLFRVLHRRPNPWQTAFEFRSLMQQRALGASGSGTKGDAYARIVRSGNKILYLVPLDTDRITPRLRRDWTPEYVYRKAKGGETVLPQRDVFHLRYGISDDGITGLSLVKQAAEAIALAIQTDTAAARLFKQGMMVGGALAHPNKLSPEAYDRLLASMERREGASNAHKWLILEEGMDAKPFSGTGRDSQNIEQRKHQIEEIARPFGVPRPLLGVDETSWGSGIDVLGQFFVRYALNPWFEAWQQAIERSLLTEREADLYIAKFNAGALLRGSMKDQAEFFAKGLGSGGHQPFLAVDEVRDWLDLPDNDNLPPPPGQTQTGTQDEPSQAA
ncbi:phage portal protein [Kaustia mangrovi]|uniref:Phage portal protein n=1 Tax=Kaustia mangrovi TaxID=2593653 RepID=A0A7S8HCA1_9HYPH|nr:phage portal protein [Kaustia mangrovi]QPC43497.1 phage portal protein [Kaustia mangrovi]